MFELNKVIKKFFFLFFMFWIMFWIIRQEFKYEERNKEYNYSVYKKFESKYYIIFKILLKKKRIDFLFLY